MTNGEIKKKGDFLTDFELHKNKSARVVPIALELYFVHGVPVDVTIRNHKNLYDFCLRQKASRSFHYEGTNRSTGEKTVYNKLIRYYVSNSGTKIIKHNTTDSRDINVEAGHWLQTIFNKYIEKEFTDYNIDRKFYIDRVNREIKAMQPEIFVNQIKLDLF